MEFRQGRVMIAAVLSVAAGASGVGADERDNFFWAGYAEGCRAAGGVMEGQQKCKPSGSILDRSVPSGVLLFPGGVSESTRVPYWGWPIVDDQIKFMLPDQEMVKAIIDGQTAYAKGYQLQNGMLQSGRAELLEQNGMISLKPGSDGAWLDWQTDDGGDTSSERAFLDWLIESPVNEGYFLDGFVIAE